MIAARLVPERDGQARESAGSKGGSSHLRKYPLFALATGRIAATVVALGSAWQRQGPESWLPEGVTAAGANWLGAEGDETNSRFSTLKQINSGNVQNLHVIWNRSFNPT